MEVEDILREHTRQDRESFEKLSDELSALRRDVIEVKLTLLNDVTEVKLALQKQKGFFAGAVFVVSAIATAIGLAVAWVKG